MRAARLVASIVVLALALSACALPNPEVIDSCMGDHVLRWDHPTHGVPARIGLYTGGAVGTIAFIPVAAVEALFSDWDGIHVLGVSNDASAYLASGLSWLLGGPFYVLGLPFEPGDEDEPRPSNESDEGGPHQR